MGGPSEEREVSLKSGAAVVEALRQAGYAVIGVDCRADLDGLPANTEAVFVAIHGAFGEDGGVQSLLEARGIPYTGTKAAAMPISFDKITTKERLTAAGLPTAAYEVLGALDAPRMAVPLVVKAPRQGSTIGLHVVMDAEKLEPALEDARRYDDRILVETYIPGRELTAGILDGKPLPLVEIQPHEGHYDYEAKYTRGDTTYLVPAPLPEVLTRHIQELALKAFALLDVRDLGRVDFRLNEAGELFILEVNTIPGFTATSLLPKAAASQGIDFPTLCAQIMELASLT
ncbi:MAG: D-alanine-D-alanine ligase [Candidatus Omnitrophota bacterium]|jgi:D-alanine-D-alanine ligase